MVAVPVALLALAAPAFDRSAIDRLVSDAVRAGNPSVAVAIVRDGRVVYRRAEGLADRQLNVRARPESVYRIGSITKPFTSTMILQLVREGKLSLDQPARMIVPELPEAWAAVTIRQLLNHSSGIPSYTNDPKIMGQRTRFPATVMQVVLSVADKPMDFVPGTRFSYNNTAYVLLGAIIEKLDGRTYEESLRARILKPLGMNQTYFTSNRAIVPGRASGYAGKQAAEYIDMDWPAGAGSMESTVLDLAKFDAALYTDKLLTAAEKEMAWKPSAPATDYGFGWSLGKVNGHPIVEHGGGIMGFITAFRRAPSRKLTVIVFTNTDEPVASPDKLARDIMGLVDPELAIPVPKAIADTAPEVTKRARSLIESFAAGKLDRSLMTPEMSARIPAQAEPEIAANLARMGPLAEIVLIADKQGARTYRVRFGQSWVRLEVTAQADGRFSSVSLRPE